MIRTFLIPLIAIAGMLFEMAGVHLLQERAGGAVGLGGNAGRGQVAHG